MRRSRSHRPTVRRAAPRTRPLAARLPPVQWSTQLVLSLIEHPGECPERRYTDGDQKGEDRYEEPSALSIQAATRKDSGRVTPNSGGVDMG